jgi:uncharacterized protein (TIGR02646 family)
MKYIKKEQEPEELRFWFDSQFDEDSKRLGCDYRNDLPSDVKRVLHNHLLTEQGFLCCYTGISINVDTSHVEHLKPYSICRQEGKHEDVDYLNLLAAYPGGNYKNADTPNRRSKKCPFGAHAKDDWYDSTNLVSPLDEDCETRFIFYDSGKIEASNAEDTAAQKSIEKLTLNHERLKDLRKEAIDEALFPTDIELDESELRSFANGAYSVKGTDGKLPEFCFVIEQVARQLVYTE